MKIGWRVVSRLIRPDEDYFLFRLSICWRIRDFYYCQCLRQLLLLLFYKKYFPLYILLIWLSLLLFLYWEYISFFYDYKIVYRIIFYSERFERLLFLVLLMSYIMRYKNNVRLVFSLWRTYYLKQCFLLLKIIFKIIQSTH